MRDSERFDERMSASDEEKYGDRADQIAVAVVPKMDRVRDTIQRIWAHRDKNAP
jgi:hypothetical protein